LLEVDAGDVDVPLCVVAVVMAPLEATELLEVVALVEVDALEVVAPVAVAVPLAELTMPAHSDCWSCTAAACSAAVHFDTRHDAALV